MASVMDVDEEEVEMASSSSGKGDKKRFEVKKVTIDLRFIIVTVSNFFVVIILFFNPLFFFQWNAVALWAWGRYFYNYSSCTK